MKSQDSAKELEERMRQAEREAKELEMKKRLAEEEREKTRKENLSQKQKTEDMVMSLWVAPFCSSLPEISPHDYVSWPIVIIYILHKAGYFLISYHVYVPIAAKDRRVGG